MLYRTIFDVKTTASSRKVSFEFGQDLATGETISSASVTATVHSGTDASPSSVVSGSATISGSKVTQLITAGTLGVTYVLSCSAATSASQTLVQQGYLTIIPATT